MQQAEAVPPEPLDAASAVVLISRSCCSALLSVPFQGVNVGTGAQEYADVADGPYSGAGSFGSISVIIA